MALFRVDFSGRGELAERQQKLGQMMSRLQKIAEEFNVAVFITNHVCSDPSGGLTFVQDPKKVRHLRERGNPNPTLNVTLTQP